MSKKQKAQLVERYGQEAADPVWLDGYEAGAAPGACSSPDMRRGHAWALGYLTARWDRPLVDMPSLYAH